MDLKALREQAINEANDDFHEEKVESFKASIKNTIHQISENNARIDSLREQNKELKKKLESSELEDFKRVEF